MVAALVAATLLGCSRAAIAHRRDFPLTYDWRQPAENEKEIELHSLYQPADGTFEQQAEFEYGVSSRLMVAPYLVFKRGGGEGWHYDAFKVESRYRLGGFSTGRVLPGLYLEYEKPRDEVGEAEGKLILSRYGDSGDEFSVNLITERALRSGAPWRATYSAGYARPLPANRYQARGGVELVRDIDDGRVTVGPVIAFRPLRKTWVVGGWGLPVLHGHGSELRLLTEYEWF